MLTVGNCLFRQRGDNDSENTGRLTRIGGRTYVQQSDLKTFLDELNNRSDVPIELEQESMSSSRIEAELTRQDCKQLPSESRIRWAFERRLRFLPNPRVSFVTAARRGGGPNKLDAED
jgi:hypothetical protein